MSYSDFKKECSSEIRAQGSNERLLALSRDWFSLANEHRYSYHFEHLGRPVIQYPQDMVQFQELVWNCRPDLIIETGVAHGGSLILSASLLSLLDVMEGLDPRLSRRRVIGIDIDIRNHNRRALDAHPLRFKMDLIEGSSIDRAVISEVRRLAESYDHVMLSLDSDHTHQHVLAELNAYADLVSVGSYCVVFDTVIEDLPSNQFSDRPWGVGNNPKTAVLEWLKKHPEFEIDSTIDDKLLISVAPSGYLRRVR